MSVDVIQRKQRAWAAGKGLEFDNTGRFYRLEDNLFQPLHPKTRQDFEAGAGGELRAGGKLHSLWSSAALACNVFDVWRDRPLGVLGHTLSLDGRYQVRKFEATHRTGLTGEPPHLDLELEGSGLPAVGIESKFVEPYRVNRNPFSASYFDSSALWSGLSKWLNAAQTISQGQLVLRSFEAAQVVKHVLGLSRTYGPDGFALVYLWYRLPGLAGDSHQNEIDRFLELVDGQGRIVVVTYQQLLGRMRLETSGWMTYLEQRYLSSD